MNPTVLTLCFLGFAIVMFVLEKIPLALTATILSLGLCVTGVLSPSDAFKGYVNSNVILCVGMFVVGQALFETGMANKIGGLVTRFAKSERQLIIAIMVIVGVMSGFLSNTGTAAVLIPVVCGIADESGFSRSRLLMPLVFAAALGGNLSIIGAPGNLMGVNALQELGLPTSFFLYAPVGIPMLVAGILYFALFGYRLLPDAKATGEVAAQRDYSDVPRWKQVMSLVVLLVVNRQQNSGVRVSGRHRAGSVRRHFREGRAGFHRLKSGAAVRRLAGAGHRAGYHRCGYPHRGHHRPRAGRGPQPHRHSAGHLCGGFASAEKTAISSSCPAGTIIRATGSSLYRKRCIRPLD